MSSPRFISDFQEFLSLVVRSGLVEQEFLNSSLAMYRTDDFSATNGYETVTAFANFLITHRILTYWQCEKLREGKYKGFFLEQYKMLDHLKSDHMYNYCLAKDTKDGTRVEIAVRHPDGWLNGKVEFEILRRLD